MAAGAVGGMGGGWFIDLVFGNKFMIFVVRRFLRKWYLYWLENIDYRLSF